MWIESQNENRLINQDCIVFIDCYRELKSGKSAIWIEDTNKNGYTAANFENFSTAQKAFDALKNALKDPNCRYFKIPADDND